MEHSIRIQTPFPGPKAQAVIEGDGRYRSPAVTRPYPMVIARGEGCWIEDPDGNRFLDFSSGIAVCSTGHAHPKVVEAVREQAGKFLHMSSTDFYYDLTVRLAEKINALAPGTKDKKVYFGNSGAEAVEAGIKLSRYYTKRKHFIAFHGAFHGRKIGSASCR